MLKIGIGHSEDVAADRATDEALTAASRSLGTLSPRGALVFCSPDIDHEKVLRGVCGTFPGIQLIGCSTGGTGSNIYDFREDSVLLALLGSDDIGMHAGVGRGVAFAPERAAREAVEQALEGVADPPCLGITTPESLGVSGAAVVRGLAAAIGDPHFPIFGGTASDGWRFKKTMQFCGDQVLQDAAPVLLFTGPLLHASGIASGWRSVGRSGRVTAVQKERVYTIDEQPAVRFYEHYFGGWSTGPAAEFPLAVYETDRAYLRAPLKHHSADGSISFAGDLPEGARVKLSEASTDDVIAAAERSILTALSAYPGRTPECGFFVSCAARQELLGTRTPNELRTVRRVIGPSLPLFGFYGYGEIGPLEPQGRAYFHNETFVSLVLGTG